MEEKEVILNSMLEISFYAKILTFSIPSTGYTSLNLYDISGRKVKNLIDEQLEEGSHSIELNELRAGIYFAVLKHEGRKISEKVVVF